MLRMSLSLLAAALLSAPTGPACTTLERTAFTMGTRLRVQVCAADRPIGLAALESGFAEVQHLDSVLSSWRSDSEIGRVNTAPPGSRVRISHELANLLVLAGNWAVATDYTFDPAIGAFIDAWGFRGTPRVPTPAALARARNASGWSRGMFADSTTFERGPSGWWIDTGGFGKGAALDRIVSVLRERGVEDATMDFGGQLMTFGQAIDLSVADPRDRHTPVQSLRVRNVSVSTSSQSERYIKSGGRQYGHILDPRTGTPVRAWGSVTVVMRDALGADALSTALFVMGPDAALGWARAHPDVGVLVLESMPHGKTRAKWSSAMQQWMNPEKNK